MLIHSVAELNLHGKNTYQAQILIDSTLKRVSTAIYRLRLIHGHNHGTQLREMIRTQYAGHPQVLRVLPLSEGVTDLVLREF